MGIVLHFLAKPLDRLPEPAVRGIVVEAWMPGLDHHHGLQWHRDVELAQAQAQSVGPPQGVLGDRQQQVGTGQGEDRRVEGCADQLDLAGHPQLSQGLVQRAVVESAARDADVGEGGEALRGDVAVEDRMPLAGQADEAGGEQLLGLDLGLHPGRGADVEVDAVLPQGFVVYVRFRGEAQGTAWRFLAEDFGYPEFLVDKMPKM